MIRGHLHIGVAGFLISLLGSLPPGLLNILAFQYSDQSGSGSALFYATGATLAEMITVLVVLSGMKWLHRQRNFFSILEWLTALFLLLFATACFVAAGSMQDLSKLLPNSGLPPFITGFLFSLLNPLHIPFWLGWSGFLYGKGTLKKTRLHYQMFTLGIGIGTLGGFLLYISGGVYFFESIQQNRFLVNIFFGIVLLAAALIHIRKIRRSDLQTNWAGRKFNG